MISKQDNWGIVLAGHWNRMIFTPEWVGARLFQQEEVETQIALMPVFPIIYRHDEVVIEVSSSRLIFRPRFDSKRSLEEAERMAVTVMDDLPNTPLMGVGINFSFVERDPPPKLISLFNLEDGRLIERAQWEAPETKISRKLTGSLGTMLLTLSQDADGKKGTGHARPALKKPTLPEAWCEAHVGITLIRQRQAAREAECVSWK